MKGVLGTVLSVGMIVESAHDHGTTGGAAGGRGKGVLKQCAIFGEGINRGSLGNRISIATEGGGLVVGNQENDIFSAAKETAEQAREIKKQGTILFFICLKNGKAGIKGQVQPRQSSLFSSEGV